jgi:DNA-binding response OmpR family regulator
VEAKPRRTGHFTTGGVVVGNMTDRPALCILLVEDDADSLSALARLLTMTGHRALAAASAEEALRLAGTQRCDIVVSDVGLPDRSGLDLMRELASLYAVPGIAVSGYTDATDVRECEAAGFALHLKKPLDFQELLDAVETITRSRDGAVRASATGDGAAAT